MLLLALSWHATTAPASPPCLVLYVITAAHRLACRLSARAASQGSLLGKPSDGNVHLHAAWGQCVSVWGPAMGAGSAWGEV